MHHTMPGYEYSMLLQVHLGVLVRGYYAIVHHHYAHTVVVVIITRTYSGMYSTYIYMYVTYFTAVSIAVMQQPNMLRYILYTHLV